MQQQHNNIPTTTSVQQKNEVAGHQLNFPFEVTKGNQATKHRQQASLSGTFGSTINDPECKKKANAKDQTANNNNTGTAIQLPKGQGLSKADEQFKVPIEGQAQVIHLSPSQQQNMGGKYFQSEHKLNANAQQYQTPEKLITIPSTAQNTPASDRNIQQKSATKEVQNVQDGPEVKKNNEKDFIGKNALYTYLSSKQSHSDGSYNQSNLSYNGAHEQSFSASSCLGEQKVNITNTNVASNVEANNLALFSQMSSKAPSKRGRKSTQQNSIPENIFPRLTNKESQIQKTSQKTNEKTDSDQVLHLAGSGPYLNSQGKPHHHPNCKGLKQGRWTKDEHFRFLEALKLYGKEWRRVQLHVCTRTSTQARSHAQKFFVKVEKRNQTLEEFLEELDLQHLENHYIFSDLEEEEEEGEDVEKGHFKVMRNQVKERKSPDRRDQQRVQKEIQSESEESVGSKSERNMDQGFNNKIKIVKTQNSGKTSASIYTAEQNENQLSPNNKRGRKRAAKEEAKLDNITNQDGVAQELDQQRVDQQKEGLSTQIDNTLPQVDLKSSQANQIGSFHINNQVAQQQNFAAPESPSKAGAITRRKSVMNLGFNHTPTRKESNNQVVGTTDRDEEMKDENMTSSMQNNLGSVSQAQETNTISSFINSSQLNGSHKQNKTAGNYYNLQTQDSAAVNYNKDVSFNQINEKREHFEPNSPKETSVQVKNEVITPDKTSAEASNAAINRRTQQMRLSKSNHSILQKRFREDDDQNVKEIENQRISRSSRTNDQLNTSSTEQFTILKSYDDRQTDTQNIQGCFKVIKNEAFITQNASKNTKAGELKEIDLPLQERQKQMQPQRQTIQEAAQQSLKNQPKLISSHSVALTPSLKSSDPAAFPPLFQLSDCLKRSNSQNEFDFLQGNLYNHGFLGYQEDDFGIGPYSKLLAPLHPPASTQVNFNSSLFGNFGLQNAQQIFDKLNHEHADQFTLGLPSKDNHYRNNNPLPFSGLAAVNGSNQMLQNQREQRNSFDLLEMQSTNLLEMTGGDFSGFLKEKRQNKLQQQHYSKTNQHAFPPSSQTLQLQRYASVQVQQNPFTNNFDEQSVKNFSKSPSGHAQLLLGHQQLNLQDQNFSNHHALAHGGMSRGFEHQQQQFLLPSSSYLANDTQKQNNDGPKQPTSQ